MNKRKPKIAMPTPVKSESRICFGILWFSTEQDAELADRLIRERGVTYNGGFFHGMSCGRDSTWDYVDDNLGPLFAVTN